MIHDFQTMSASITGLLAYFVFLFLFTLSISFLNLYPPNYKPIVNFDVRQPKITAKRPYHNKHISRQEEDNKIDHHPATRVLLLHRWHKISENQSKVTNQSHYHLVAQLYGIYVSVLVRLSHSKVNSYDEITVEQEHYLRERVILEDEYRANEDQSSNAETKSVTNS